MMGIGISTFYKVLVHAYHVTLLLILRRKKLTTHWRSFIHPLMWRCKWVELQIKKLQSRAQLYDRELEVYDEKKQTQLDDSTVVYGTKSLPFSQKTAKPEVFRRRKRRRTEATADVAAYMLQHNLFSCYGRNVYLLLSNFFLCCFLPVKNLIFLQKIRSALPRVPS